MNDCQLQFASAFFTDTEDVAAVELVEPVGAVTRAAAEEAWPDVADLAFVGQVDIEDEDEEDASPGDIEEDPDDLPVNNLVALRAAAQVVHEEQE